MRSTKKSFGSMKSVSDLSISTFLRVDVARSQIRILWSLELLEVPGVPVIEVIRKEYKLQ